MRVNENAEDNMFFVLLITEILLCTGILIAGLYAAIDLASSGLITAGILLATYVALMGSIGLGIALEHLHHRGPGGFIENVKACVLENKCSNYWPHKIRERFCLRMITSLGRSGAVMGYCLSVIILSILLPLVYPIHKRTGRLII